MARTMKTILAVLSTCAVLGCATAPAPIATTTGVATAAPQTGWRGNLHTHSLWSDGIDYPEMIVAWYRDHGYHFLSLTEHDLLQRGERWVDMNAPDDGWPPRNASARRALAGYRARFGPDVDEQVDGARHLVRLRPINEYRDRFEEPGAFLLLEGEEITDAAGSHVNAFNIATPILPQGGNDARARLRNNLHEVMTQQRAIDRPVAAIANHPNYTWAWTAEDIAGIPEARLFEVYNGHALVNNAGDSLHASSERIWDVALTLRHAAGLPPLFAVATDDAHDYGADADTISRPGRGWVMVRAPTLTPDALVDALNGGRFYASTGVAIRREQYDDDRIRIEIDAQPGVTYRTQFIGTRRSVALDSDPVLDAAGDTVRTTQRYDPGVGAVLAEVEGASAEYVFDGDERYVRAQVTSSSPHIDPTTGRTLGLQKAWLQPVFR